MLLFVAGFDLVEVYWVARFLLAGLILTYAGLMSLFGLVLRTSVRGAAAVPGRVRDIRVTRAEDRRQRYAEPDPDDAPAAYAPDAAAPARYSRPERLSAAPAPLAADPLPYQADAPEPDAVPRPGLLARLRRKRESEADLAGPAYDPDLLPPDMPPEDRLRARISLAIKARSATAAHTAAASAGARPEPPVTASAPLTARAGRPQPLIVRPGSETLPPDAHPRATLSDGLLEAPDFDAADFSPAADFDPDPTDGPVITDMQRPAPDPRRSLVQPTARKPGPPSRQAQAEAQPSLRFDETARRLRTRRRCRCSPAPLTIQRHTLSQEALEENARMLETVLDDYGVRGEIVSVRPGPVVTMYELEPAPGLKASPRHRPRRRHRAVDVRALGPRLHRPRPHRHRHRTAQRHPREGGPARDPLRPRLRRHHPEAPPRPRQGHRRRPRSSPTSPRCRTC